MPKTWGVGPPDHDDEYVLDVILDLLKQQEYQVQEVLGWQEGYRTILLEYSAGARLLGNMAELTAKDDDFDDSLGLRFAALNGGVDVECHNSTGAFLWALYQLGRQ